MDVSNAYLIIGAIVAGMIVQMAMSMRQQRQFTTDVAAMRRVGNVAVGVGGKRYRGGRVYLVLCADKGGIVRDALQLRGFSTLTRAKPFPLLIGKRLTELVGDREVPGLDKSQRQAARQAAEALRAARKEETAPAR